LDKIIGGAISLPPPVIARHPDVLLWSKSGGVAISVMALKQLCLQILSYLFRSYLNVSLLGVGALPGGLSRQGKRDKPPYNISPSRAAKGRGWGIGSLYINSIIAYDQHKLKMLYNVYHSHIGGGYEMAAVDS
jgi:hypothetical protein